MSTLVTSSPPQPRSHFSRRVSFNNLHPDDYLNDPAAALTTSSGGLYGKTTSPKSSFSSGPMDATFGYGSAVLNDISKAYSTSNYTPVKKKLRLPDPPSKSILKNKISPQQLEFNEKNGVNYNNILKDTTINYHKDIDEMAVDFTDDNVTLVKEDGENFSVPQPKNRRKSYSDMTTEELMALDPQFQTTKSKTNNVDQFKFDNQKTYYRQSSGKRGSVSAAAAAAAKQQLEYPTSNENNYKSISLTVKHDEYDTIPFNRTILSVISGRRHTWNSLDWLFLINQDDESPESSFLTDGDYLIVSSLIPLKFLKEYGKKNKKCSLDDYLYKKCENLLNYIVNNQLVLNSNLKLKITVEFIPDNEEVSTSGIASGIKPFMSNKYMLHHLFKQYQPNLLVIGNKSSNLNFKYPIKIKRQNERDEYLIKLSSYIVKYSTVPVILVGSSTKFHNGMCHHSAGRGGLKFDVDGHPSIGAVADSPKVAPPMITFSTDSSDSLKLHKYESNSSSASSSIESVESFNGDGERLNTKRAFEEKFSSLKSLSNDNENKFKDLITLISENSLNEANEYLIAINSKDDSIKINNKIHSIYRSQTTGGSMLHNNGSHDDVRSNHSNDRIYKVKSLISYSEDDEAKNDKLRTQMKQRRRSSAGKSACGPNGVLGGSSDSSLSTPKDEKKKSIWKKFGFKK
ncbi:uncharacterized protein RJT20DRAFT_35556 [Scheffersomyces xylosifermentans]|uniref:uncharacterized protein n=1 Tax=Scheffersomyces xylosifermentans TaxID=1304137 RepID=UPI00315C7CAB